MTEALGKQGPLGCTEQNLVEVGPELGFMLWQKLDTGVGELAFRG